MDTNEKSVTLPPFARNGDIMPDIESQQNKQSQSSPFHHHSTGSKYLHKKFKRIASTEFDDKNLIAETHINGNEPESTGDAVDKSRLTNGTVPCDRSEIHLVNGQRKCTNNGSSSESSIDQPLTHGKTNYT